MPRPPVPESPNRQIHRHLPPRGAPSSSGTPRVGMQLFQNDDDDDDDVSVLTFHTMGTNGSNSSFVKAARENLERMILEGKNPGDNNDDGKSLTRISEEAGSRNSCSYESRSRSSSKSSSKSRCSGSSSSSCSSKHSRSSVSPSSSLVKSSNEKENTSTATEEHYDERDDDDTISLAESILDSANKVLSSIGQSPYYAGRSKSKKVPSSSSSSSSSVYDSPQVPRPNKSNQLSPMKQRSAKQNDTDDNNNGHVYNMEKEFTTPKEMKNNQNNNNDDRLEVANNFLSSYFADENIKPSSTNHRSTHIKNSNINSISSYKSISSKSSNSTNKNEDQKLEKLESETKQLQMLLKERQLQTQKASQSLGTSIEKARELLRKYDAESN